MAGHGGLPDALAGTEHRDRRKPELGEGRRLEPEVRPYVGNAGREHSARESEALDRSEDRLVREVDHEIGPVALDRRFDVAGEGHAVVALARLAAELLRPADEHGRHELVLELVERGAHDLRVVLTVDDRESPLCGGARGAQVRAVTSSSIAPVNFAYSRVSSENDTSFTWPWNGCRRQMSTFRSAISMTL